MAATAVTLNGLEDHSQVVYRPFKMLSVEHLCSSLHDFN